MVFRLESHAQSSHHTRHLPSFHTPTLHPLQHEHLRLLLRLMTALARASWSWRQPGALSRLPTSASSSTDLHNHNTTPYQTHNTSPCTTPWRQHCSTSPTYTSMHCSTTGVISATVSPLTHPHFTHETLSVRLLTAHSAAQMPRMP